MQQRGCVKIGTPSFLSLPYSSLLLHCQLVFGRFPVELVEVCKPFGTVAEQTNTDAFPVAVMHVERLSGRNEGTTIQTVEESVAVMNAIVLHTQIYSFELATTNKCALVIMFYDDSLRRDAHPTEFASNARQSCIAVATSLNDRGTFRDVTHHLLREHVMTGP